MLRLLTVTLPIYFVWEMLQAPAFTGMPPHWLAATAVCAQATLGDGVIVLGLFGVGAAVFRDPCWFSPPRWTRYAVIAAAGVLVQVLVEWLMVHRLGRWGYGAIHPVIPLVDVGVLPVLQAIVLVPTVFWLTSRFRDAHHAVPSPTPGSPGG